MPKLDKEFIVRNQSNAMEMLVDSLTTNFSLFENMSTETRRKLLMSWISGNFEGQGVVIVKWSDFRDGVLQVVPQ